jgi:hypothetical protein
MSFLNETKLKLVMQYFKSLLILLFLIGYATSAQARLDHADIYCETAKGSGSSVIVIINKAVTSYKADIFIGGAGGEHIRTEFVMPAISNSMQYFRDHQGTVVVNAHLERPIGNITIKTSFGKVLLNELPLRCEKNVPLEHL